MTSIIKDLIKKYRKQAENQEGWKLTNTEAAVSDA